uniref:Beta-lactamase n=1 Tax=Ascaris lumbricoides TaxID=6252 RepID=A0A0M3I6D5_ASCLU
MALLEEGRSKEVQGFAEEYVQTGLVATIKFSEAELFTHGMTTTTLMTLLEEGRSKEVQGFAEEYVQTGLVATIKFSEAELFTHGMTTTTVVLLDDVSERSQKK